MTGTTPPRHQRPRTHAEAADAAEATIRAALSGPPRRPTRHPREPDIPPDLSPAGDLAAWDRARRRDRDVIRYEALSGDPAWQVYGYLPWP